MEITQTQLTLLSAPPTVVPYGQRVQVSQYQVVNHIFVFITCISVASDGTDLLQFLSSELSISVTAWASLVPQNVVTATWSLFLGFTPVFFLFFNPHITYTVTTVMLYWAATGAKINLGTTQYCGRTHCEDDGAGLKLQHYGFDCAIYCFILCYTFYYTITITTKLKYFKSKPVIASVH